VGIVVLTLGLVCFMTTYLFVSYIHGYERNFANVDRTYVIAQSIVSESNGLDVPFRTGSALRLGEHLRLDVPELDAVARLHRTFTSVAANSQAAARTVAYVEAPFFEIFNFVSVAGELDTAAMPRMAVITESAAQSLFGAEAAVGKTLTVGGARNVDVTVAAVIADLPVTSHLSPRALAGLGFEVLVSWDVFEAIARTPFIDSWGNTTVVTYALLPADGSLTVAEVNRRLAGIVERHIPPEMRAQATIAFEAHPIASVASANLQARFEGFTGTKWRIDIFDALLMFASVVLAIACVNFVNLATAQASGRGLDVGTRRTLGATSALVIRQDLVQTTTVVAAAIALALGATVLLRPLIPNPWQTALELPWSESRFWLFLAALIVSVTAAAGLYPALVLARIRPTSALRLGKARSGPKLLRTVLVGAQFATASFLIALVVVLIAQRDNLRDALLGRFADPYVTFYLGPPGAVPDREVLTRELARGPGIRGATYMWLTPFQSAGPRIQLSRTADESSARFTMDDQAVGYDYFALLDVPILAGRVFERDRADDVTPRTREAYEARQGKPFATLLDREAARRLGWPNPADAVGEIIYAAGRQGVRYEIIGVVESVTMNVRSRGSTGMRFGLDPTISNQWIVRVGKDGVEASLAHINDVLKALAPGRSPPRLSFLDEVFENAYWAFRMMNYVFTGLAVFAIAIAVIGLFGMASYMTSRRTYEIGVRKCQGASFIEILRLLAWDFSKPVMFANVVAWPFVLYAAGRYLELFTERIAVTPLPFALALLATLMLAWVAVGGVVFRAAGLRPADALRHE
jgi:putative ABC transport system permease protein